MGYEDNLPAGGGYRKPMDPKQLKQMKERWKESETIRELSIKHHREHEVPKADEELLKDLEKTNNTPKPAPEPPIPPLAPPAPKPKKALWPIVIILIIIIIVIILTQ